MCNTAFFCEIDFKLSLCTVDNRFAPIVYLWDANSGELVSLAEQNNPITHISFSPNGEKIALLSFNGILEIWQTGE